mgnify:CR=1 FL=1
MFSPSNVRLKITTVNFVQIFTGPKQSKQSSVMRGLASSPEHSIPRNSTRRWEWDTAPCGSYARVRSHPIPDPSLPLSALQAAILSVRVCIPRPLSADTEAVSRSSWGRPYSRPCHPHRRKKCAVLLAMPLLLLPSPRYVPPLPLSTRSICFTLSVLLLQETLATALGPSVLPSGCRLALFTTCNS